MGTKNMIIGNGDLASVLPNKEGFLFFVSGVSNSQETRESEYQREIDLLLEQPRAAHIVYFSSLGVFESGSRYYSHKRDMEIMVKTNFPKNTIIRLGNISWGDNPHTLINFLKDKIHNNKRYEVLDTYRYVINKEEFLHWINLIPDWNCEMDCPGRFMKVQEIVDEIKRGKL